MVRVISQVIKNICNWKSVTKELLNVEVDTARPAVRHLHKLRPFGSVAPGWEVNLGNNDIRHTNHVNAPQPSRSYTAKIEL